MQITGAKSNLLVPVPTTFFVAMGGPGFEPKPTILVFSTSGIEGGLKKIKDKATVHQAFYTNANEPSALLSAHPSAQAIWIADPEIVLPKHRQLSQQVVEYVRDGGTAIIGGFFTSFVRPDDFNYWLRDAWNLPWEFGQYERTTVIFQNSANGRPHSHWRNGMPAAYSSKAVFLKNVAPYDAWYVSSSGSMSESLVFGPSPVEEQTSVAFAEVGNGWLGYTGDVNNEDGTTAAVLAMMGLNIDD